jgi:hypothetical protein
MRIRVEGTRAEIALGLNHLRRVFMVTAMSRAYPHRAHPRKYRVYVRVVPRTAP